MLLNTYNCHVHVFQELQFKLQDLKMDSKPYITWVQWKKKHNEWDVKTKRSMDDHFNTLSGSNNNIKKKEHEKWKRINFMC
jgi:hypothetical protein